MAASFRNFDTFIKEKKKLAPSFEMFGNTYTLPPSLRYDAVLELQRLNKRQDTEEMSDEDTFNIFELFIGTQTLAELRANDDFTVDVAAELVKWALQQYGLITADGEPANPKSRKKILSV
jgi:hypothetical protein